MANGAAETRDVSIPEVVTGRPPHSAHGSGAMAPGKAKGRDSSHPMFCDFFGSMEAPSVSYRFCWENCHPIFLWMKS